MKVGEMIAQFDLHAPNVVEQDEKIRWLSRIDGMVFNELIETHEGGHENDFEGYSQGAEGCNLLIDDNHCDVYLFYMDMRLYYHLGESTRYNNAKAQFDECYAAYSRWYHKHHTPKRSAVRWGW